MSLIIMRGCPGSGKSTLSKKIEQDADLKTDGVAVFSTDNYWLRPDGIYDFNFRYIKEAHQWNRSLFEKTIKAQLSLPDALDFTYIVDNTNDNGKYAEQLKNIINTSIKEFFIGE
jgi:NEDD4-binding protein 2